MDRFTEQAQAERQAREQAADTRRIEQAIRDMAADCEQHQKELAARTARLSAALASERLPWKKARILHWPERLDDLQCYRHGLFRAVVDDEVFEFVGRHDARPWPEVELVLLGQLAEALERGDAVPIAAASQARSMPRPALSARGRTLSHQPAEPAPLQAPPAPDPVALSDAPVEQLSLL